MKVWIVLVVLVFTISVPLISIWSINTLFLPHRHIPYNILTWLASLWLILLMGARNGKSKGMSQK